jgi:hypothetical protein
VSRKKSESELDAARCSARSKATGERCRRWAVAGCQSLHRPRGGRPQAPPGRSAAQTGANARTRARHGFRHGLYSKRLPREVGRVVAEFQGDQEALFDLKAVAARLWTLLMRCDEVEASLADGDPA